MTQFRSSLDQELIKVQDEIVRMGSLLQEAIRRAMQALETLDEDQARRIVAEDAQINAIRFNIEELCLGLIARQQPAAKDLRAVVAVMNIVTDLERVGDHAASIAKTVLRMIGDEAPRSLPIGLHHMAELSQDMLRRVLEAYLVQDVELAYQIAGQDDLVDHQYKTLFSEILQIILEAPDQAERCLRWLFVGHSLERIADRATNVAERVIFMASGEMHELNTESVTLDDLTG